MEKCAVMRLAILAEVHANLPALEAALQAARQESVDQVWAVGDLIGYGPHPRQVLRRLDREGIPCVPGSADLKVAFAMMGMRREGVADSILAWTSEQLSRRELQFLRSLRPRQRIELKGGRLTALHGLPDDPEAKLDTEASARDLLEMFGKLRTRWGVFAGRHIPFYRRVGDGLVIDPGSVGLTLGGEPGADVLILDEDLEGRLNLRFLKVPYDFGQVIFDLTAWELPPIVAEVIRLGRYPG
jgi:predicted phosphodiesterase